MRLTVGPLPPAVYWRRRAIVLAVALLILFVVAQACMTSASPESPDPAAGDTTTPGGAGTSAPPPTGPPDTGAPTSAPAQPPADPPSDPPASDQPAAPPAQGGCTDDQLRVVASAEPASFAQETRTVFAIRLERVGDGTCRRDTGSGQRELYLRADGEAGSVWSSRDCRTLDGEEVQDLGPGFASQIAWTEWLGHGSDECDGVEPAGDLLAPGEYELVARVGTAASEPVTITIR